MCCSGFLHTPLIMDEKSRGVAPGGRTAQIGPGGVAAPRFCWRKETLRLWRGPRLRRDVFVLLSPASSFLPPTNNTLSDFDFDFVLRDCSNTLASCSSPYPSYLVRIYPKKAVGINPTLFFYKQHTERTHSARHDTTHCA